MNDRSWQFSCWAVLLVDIVGDKVVGGMPTDRPTVSQ